MPSPRKSRKSLGPIGSARSSAVNKENQLASSPVARRKRAKSLDGTHDDTVDIVRKRRNTSASRVPVAPRSILKSKYGNNDDNHTVIGIMQVALREEAVVSSKPSRDFNRRVSFAPEATLHTFDIDIDRSMNDSASTSSTPRSSRLDENASSPPVLRSSPKSLSPLSIMRRQSSPVGVNGSRDPTHSMSPELADRFLNAEYEDSDMEVDSEVEMEDATDVFDDLFNNAAVSTGQSQSTSTLQTTVRAGGSALPDFFSQYETEDNEKAMDMTTVFGGIAAEHTNNEEEDDIPMDLTYAIGAIDPELEETMDITRAVGHIENDTSPTDISMTMDMTRGVGLIQTSRDDQAEDDYSMDITKAVGMIQADDVTITAPMDITRSVGFVHNEDEDDAEVPMNMTVSAGRLAKVDDDNVTITAAMDITKAIGHIEPADNDDGETVDMDITRAVGIVSHGDDDADMDVSMEISQAVPFSQVIETSKSISQPVPPPPYSATPMRTNQLTTDKLSTTPVSAKTVTPELSARSIRRSVNIVATPTRSGGKPILREVYLAPQGGTGARISPRPSPIMKRRKSLLDAEIQDQRFTGDGVSIGTPESQVLKTAINDALFQFSTSSLQKRIQSLTPKKAARTPSKLQLSARRDEAMTSLQAEEQSALARIYSPIKDRAGPPASTTKTPRQEANVFRMHVEAGTPRSRGGYSPVSLTEFLSMISVQFLTGLNTKRRNTTFLQPAEHQVEPTFTSSVLSRQLQRPLLELYEFSCRELRKNIQEGNEMFERLDDETSEENPALFRRYMSATVDTQVAYCAQFKMIKNYARLQSKGVWYEWRAKLLDGVMNTLTKNLAALKEDAPKLAEVDNIVGPTIAEIRDRHYQLKTALEQLHKRKLDVEECDQEEVDQARLKLVDARSAVKTKRTTKLSLESEQAQLTESLDCGNAALKATRQAISDAERIIEENRGVDTAQVETAKQRLDLINELYGWRVDKAVNNRLSVSTNYVRVLMSCDEGRIDEIRVTCPDVEMRALLENCVLSTPTTIAELKANKRSLLLFEQAVRYASEELEWLQSRYITRITADEKNQQLYVTSEILIPDTATKVRATYTLTLGTATTTWTRANTSQDGRTRWLRAKPAVNVVYTGGKSQGGSKEVAMLVPEYACRWIVPAGTKSGDATANLLGVFHDIC
ncbi:Spc7 kinetochore protein-domain-containing protein [Limtongia smithiae]|uniref:Spc7 kinetochore protein-domain-containing protein n=1 Tax=Limtongia smithiae TaxID=1125753 RepID=UPI0034CF1170